MTLHLAETHGNAELFKEASRFVLDIAQWDKKEMGVLSERTQLKLSMRWVISKWRTNSGVKLIYRLSGEHGS